MEPSSVVLEYMLSNVKENTLNSILKLTQDVIQSIYCMVCHCWCLYISAQSCSLVGTKKLKAEFLLFAQVLAVRLAKQ